MTVGLGRASYSLPEWQAVKTDFLCTLNSVKIRVCTGHRKPGKSRN